MYRSSAARPIGRSGSGFNEARQVVTTVAGVVVPDLEQQQQHSEVASPCKAHFVGHCCWLISLVYVRIEAAGKVAWRR